MLLDHATWFEVRDYLSRNNGIILPVGSTEQHGPMGLIGTDAMCAQAIAKAAGEIANICVAPVLAYTPAPFNTAFPGTISVSETVFSSLFTEIVTGLQDQGFQKVYVLNAHGANLAPMRRASEHLSNVRIRSWWDFAAVNEIRSREFGDWEGLHATPSEISITQTLFRSVAPGEAAKAPRQLDDEEIGRRAGDRHGPPELHRSEFPDGRVGSHSALASPEIGERLLAAAGQSLADDFGRFVSGS